MPKTIDLFSVRNTLSKAQREQFDYFNKHSLLSISPIFTGKESSYKKTVEYVLRDLLFYSIITKEGNAATVRSAYNDSGHEVFYETFGKRSTGRYEGTVYLPEIGDTTYTGKLIVMNAGNLIRYLGKFRQLNKEKIANDYVIQAYLNPKKSKLSKGKSKKVA